MIQGNQRALATSRSLWAKDGRVGSSNELGPVSVNDLSERFYNRLGDIVQKGWGRFVAGEGESFQLKTFAFEVIVYKVDNLTVGNISRRREIVEIGQDELGPFAGGL